MAEREPTTPGEATAVHERLAAYFAGLGAQFENFPSRGVPVTEQWLNLAGRPIRLEIAGQALEPVLGPALTHLVAAAAAPPRLHVRCWDGAETGVAPPPPPWGEKSGAGRVVLPPGGECFRVSDTGGGDSFAMLRRDTGEAFFWTREARRLPTFHYAAPLVEVFHAWGRAQGLTVLHAGCVGDERGAVLLGGRGGSGKSTTSLLCLEAGMKFLSDDFCLLEPGAVTTMHGLFSSAKLHRVDLPRFPRLAALAEDPMPDVFDKPVIYLRRAFAERMAKTLPLRAVVLPRVERREETAFESIPAAEALRLLAPSTLFQLPGEGTAPLQAMAAAVRGVPCFRLNLGSRLASVAPAVRAILDHVS